MDVKEEKNEENIDDIEEKAEGRAKGVLKWRKKIVDLDVYTIQRMCVGLRRRISITFEPIYFFLLFIGPRKVYSYFGG